MRRNNIVVVCIVVCIIASLLPPLVLSVLQYRPHNMVPGNFAKYPGNPLHPPVSTTASFLNDIPHHHHHHHHHHQQQQQQQGREFGFPLGNDVFGQPSHVHTNAPFGAGESAPLPFVTSAGQGPKQQKMAYPVLQGPGKLDSGLIFAPLPLRAQPSSAAKGEPDGRREPQLPPKSPWMAGEHEDRTIGATSQPSGAESSSASVSFAPYSSDPNWSTVWAGLSMPGSYQSDSTWSASSLMKPSVMETTSSWSQWSTSDTDQVRGSAQATCDEREDLVHLLRRLDIGEQHADSLLVSVCVCVGVCCVCGGGVRVCVLAMIELHRAIIISTPKVRKVGFSGSSV